MLKNLYQKRDYGSRVRDIIAKHIFIKESNPAPETRVVWKCDEWEKSAGKKK